IWLQVAGVTVAISVAISRVSRGWARRRRGSATDVYADTIHRVCGDDVDLDPIEKGLIHLKRHRVISGRRLVTLVARHQREIRPE
ncbi:hypothetical protein, partial [Rhodovulum sulfidophilum]|uniref:hypothetical protein n=1 Tax=Rhodovulum sulfidophilum TaxID=35806 RepID=UPI001F23DFCB